jgi:hypothetical protein
MREWLKFDSLLLVHSSEHTTLSTFVCVHSPWTKKRYSFICSGFFVLATAKIEVFWTTHSYENTFLFYSSSKWKLRLSKPFSMNIFKVDTFSPSLSLV